MKKRRRHRNPNGHWCNCPWGAAQLNDPIDDLWDVERYGSTKVAWIKESAKLDWLRGRPDMQEPYHQKFLDYLEANHPEHDNLFPWLARERKKGRLNEGVSGPNEDPAHLRFINHDGRSAYLDNDHLQILQDWMKYKKQAKQGVDIMQHHIGDAIHQSDKWDGMGEIVHEVNDPNYEGWTIRRLRNKRDMRKEGERMNHCVGSNGMPYIPRQERGDGEYYSLRDKGNDPHATLELDNHSGVTRHQGADPSNPTGQHYSASEYYGPNDNPVPWEHDQLMHEFFHPRGIYPEPNEGHEEGEYFEPWWDSEYEINGPTTAEEWLQHANGEYVEANTPDEYDRAQADAYEHELDPPDLMVGDPDIYDIWNDMVWNQTREKGDGVDPHHIAAMFKTMDDEGMGDEFRSYAKDWLEDDYNRYLEGDSPYGTSPDWQRPDQWKDPHAPPAAQGTLNAPGMPGSYYPGRANPHDEWFARNLDYHLNKYADPQTGEVLEQHQLEQQYPQISPGHDPKITDEPHRATDPPLSPPAQRITQPSPYAENPQLNIPTGTDQGAENWPTDRGASPPQWHYPEGWQQRDPLGRGDYDQRQPVPFRGEPQLWEEGGTTNWHQMPVPGLADQAPNPGHVNQYFRGEQQGTVFPKHWYVDRYKSHSAPTELPPHLFPPDRFTWHELQPHPQQLPMWSANPAHIPDENPRWDHDTRQFDFDNPRINPTFPPEGQSWNLTQGDISDANYLNPYEKGPQTSIAPGGNHPTVPYSAKYHPRDDEEWVDDDEPDFSATIPEPRWNAGS